MSYHSLDIQRLFSLAGAYTHGAVIPVDGGTSIHWLYAQVDPA